MTTLTDRTSTIALFDDDAASRCVQCGLCLQHCPTYLDSRDEAESPRGRIALMRAMTREELTPDARLRAHLSSCLTCRACEPVCPAGVPYGELIDGGRAWLAENAQHPIRERLGRRLLLEGLVPHPRRLRAVARLARAWQRSGLRWIARRSRLLRVTGLSALEASLPDVPPLVRWRRSYPPPGRVRGRVGLFVGCVAPLLDPRTTADAIRVLNALGHEVIVPPEQGCCGALHRHAGASITADRLAERNICAFAAENGAEAVLTTASGCGAVLREYGKAPGGAAAAEFAARVSDISTFVAAGDADATWRRAPAVALRVAVQDPCTLRNVMRCAPDVYRMLEAVPGIDIVPLAGNALCCGSAGVNHVVHAEQANRLREPKLAAARETRPDVLATSNVGCAMHLAAGLRRDGESVPVLHPVSLVAWALAADTGAAHDLPRMADEANVTP